MANIERITCDVAGCTKELAYRIKGFNLCAEHCFEPGEFLEMVRAVMNREKDSSNPEVSHG